MNKRILLSVFALAFIYVLSSCGDHSHENSDHEHSHDTEEAHDHDETEHSHDHDHDAPDQTGKEYTSAYVCPMHCEGSGSEEAGQCPVCEMDYVENSDAKDDGDEETSAPA